MANKYKQKAEAARVGRRAVQHVTPDEVVAEPQEKETPSTSPIEQTQQESSEQSPQETPKKEVEPEQTKADIRTLAVDKTAKAEPVGSRMFPDRHQQVLLEAFEMGNNTKPWQIVEIALSEYFERRYGKPKKK